MKIRTDFVTNSSSSCFVVDLDLQLLDGTAISIGSCEESGDDESTICSFTAKDESGRVIASGKYDPFEYCCTEMGDSDPYDTQDILDEVYQSIDVRVSSINLIGISNATSVKALIAAITEPFGLDCHCEKNKDATQIVAALQKRFNSMVDNCGKVLRTHLSKVSDLKKAKVSMAFWGRGEFIAGPEEILQNIVGWNQKIIDILSADNENEIMKKLRVLKELDRFSDDSLHALIDFWKNFDYAYDSCNISQVLRPDGKIDLSFSWDDEAPEKIIERIDRIEDVAISNSWDDEVLEKAVEKTNQTKDFDVPQFTEEDVNVPEEELSLMEIEPVNVAWIKGSIFVFTGLDSEEEIAVKLIVENGGEVKSSVVLKTNYVVYNPNFGWETVKLKKAKELIEKGKPIQLLTTNEFCKKLTISEALQENEKKSFEGSEKSEKVSEATPPGSNNTESGERISAAEAKVEGIIRALKERYPEGSDLPKSFEEMKFYNSDLQLSTLDKWTKIAYQTKARDFLIQEGLLRGKSKEQHLPTKAKDDSRKC